RLTAGEHRLDRLVDRRGLGQADRIGRTEHADRVVQERPPGLADLALERCRVFVLELTHGSPPPCRTSLAPILLPFAGRVPPYARAPARSGSSFASRRSSMNRLTVGVTGVCRRSMIPPARTR